MKAVKLYFGRVFVELMVTLITLLDYQDSKTVLFVEFLLKDLYV